MRKKTKPDDAEYQIILQENKRLKEQMNALNAQESKRARTCMELQTEVQTLKDQLNFTMTDKATCLECMANCDQCQYKAKAWSR